MQLRKSDSDPLTWDAQLAEPVADANSLGCGRPALQAEADELPVFGLAGDGCPSGDDDHADQEILCRWRWA
jgi:hypothetical protein